MDEIAKHPDGEAWEWPEETWRRIVERARAGRSLAPKTWPNGARCAVALSFDSDHETSDLREGGKSIGRLAWGQYGARVGVPRILKLLDKYQVKASFYVPAVTALLHPDEQRRVVAEGHEIGIHGWIHELNSVLPGDAERELMLRSADTLERISGSRPVSSKPNASCSAMLRLFWLSTPPISMCRPWVRARSISAASRALPMPRPRASSRT
jgi:hypothetical protein